MENSKKHRVQEAIIVVFLYHPDHNDLFAFFPEVREKFETYLSYSTLGQHQPCHIDYAKECEIASPTQFVDLASELSEKYKLNIRNQKDNTAFKFLATPKRNRSTY